MKTKVLNYRIVVEKEKQGSKEIFVAYAPTLGVSDFGKTIEEAVSNIEKAMKLFIDTLIETGETVPQPDNDDYFITTRTINLDHPVSFTA